MRIAVVGRGNVGGGLADLWEAAGHQLARFGRDGGDVSDAEIVLVAIPGGAIAEALARCKRGRSRTPQLRKRFSA
jgi:predicted dinucleotide-binding enzyme